MVDVYVKRAFAIDPRSPPTSIETRVKLNWGYAVSSQIHKQKQSIDDFIYKIFSKFFRKLSKRVHFKIISKFIKKVINRLFL